MEDAELFWLCLPTREVCFGINLSLMNYWFLKWGRFLTSYQPGPTDPYAFHNVFVMSMQEILQLMSSLNRNCFLDSFMTDLGVCNCAFWITTTHISLQIQQQKFFQLMVLDDQYPFNKTIIIISLSILGNGQVVLLNKALASASGVHLWKLLGVMNHCSFN